MGKKSTASNVNQESNQSDESSHFKKIKCSAKKFQQKIQNAAHSVEVRVEKAVNAVGNAIGEAIVETVVVAVAPLLLKQIKESTEVYQRVVSLRNAITQRLSEVKGPFHDRQALRAATSMVTRLNAAIGTWETAAEHFANACVEVENKTIDQQIKHDEELKEQLAQATEQLRHDSASAVRENKNAMLTAPGFFQQLKATINDFLEYLGFPQQFRFNTANTFFSNQAAIPQAVNQVLQPTRP